jgi:hypothetical protein
MLDAVDILAFSSRKTDGPDPCTRHPEIVWSWLAADELDDDGD